MRYMHTYANFVWIVFVKIACWIRMKLICTTHGFQINLFMKLLYIKFIWDWYDTKTEFGWHMNLKWKKNQLENFQMQHKCLGLRALNKKKCQCCITHGWSGESWSQDIITHKTDLFFSNLGVSTHRQLDCLFSLTTKQPSKMTAYPWQKGPMMPEGVSMSDVIINFEAWLVLLNKDLHALSRLFPTRCQPQTHKTFKHASSWAIKGSCFRPRMFIWSWSVSDKNRNIFKTPSTLIKAFNRLLSVITVLVWRCWERL